MLSFTNFYIKNWTKYIQTGGKDSNNSGQGRVISIYGSNMMKGITTVQLRFSPIREQPRAWCGPEP